MERRRGDKKCREREPRRKRKRKLSGVKKKLREREVEEGRKLIWEV